jgi:hypothetical protein
MISRKRCGRCTGFFIETSLSNMFDKPTPPVVISGAARDFLMKGLAFQPTILYNTTCPMRHGRLAQLVEHSLDVRRVSGSSPLSSTRKKCIAILFLRGIAMHFIMQIIIDPQADPQHSQNLIFCACLALPQHPARLLQIVRYRSSNIPQSVHLRLRLLVGDAFSLVQRLVILNSRGRRQRHAGLCFRKTDPPRFYLRRVCKCTKKRIII